MRLLEGKVSNSARGRIVLSIISEGGGERAGIAVRPYIELVIVSIDIAYYYNIAIIRAI